MGECGRVLNIKPHGESCRLARVLARSVLVFGVCDHLTDIDSPTVALHQEQHKHMQRDQVDNKHVTPPRRHLEHKYTDMSVNGHSSLLSFL